MDINIDHAISTEDIAYALGGFNQQEVRRFARDLLNELSGVDESLVDAFAEGVASAQAQLKAEP